MIEYITNIIMENYNEIKNLYKNIVEINTEKDNLVSLLNKIREENTE